MPERMVLLFQVLQKVRLISALESWLNNSNTMSFYAVAKGRSVGVFMTWAECEAQVKGFSGAKYKKFGTQDSAQEFIASFTGPSNSHASNTKPYANTSNFNLKRAYSTSTNFPNTKLSKSKSQHQDDTESDRIQSDDDLDTILNKQMDDIEKRVTSFGKGVDKILSSSKSTSRSAILIEPIPTKKSKKNDYGFEVDDKGYVQVYTDGACSGNGRNGARAGIGVYWGEGHPLNVSEPVSGRATNNCGEIQAATRAIKQAIESGLKKLTINTDSKFVINAVTKWIPGWKRKGWKLASGDPVKNEIDFKDLDSISHKIDVKWNYVEAHRGIYGNERADALAKAGAAMYGKQ